MSLGKRLIFTLVFVVAALVVPFCILMAFVDSASHFAVYVVVFGIIIFATLGYVLACAVSTRKNVETALEELKIQNAAIAFKLTSVFKENPEALDELLRQANAQPEEKPAEEAAPVDTSKISLNPADPLVMPETPKTESKQEVFDDFQ